MGTGRRGRPQRPLDTTVPALAELAQELRELRAAAGLTLDNLYAVTHWSKGALSAATQPGPLAGPPPSCPRAARAGHPGRAPAQLAGAGRLADPRPRPAAVGGRRPSGPDPAALHHRRARLHRHRIRRRRPHRPLRPERGGLRPHRYASAAGPRRPRQRQDPAGPPPGHPAADGGRRRLRARGARTGVAARMASRARPGQPARLDRRRPHRLHHRGRSDPPRAAPAAAHPRRLRQSDPASTRPGAVHLRPAAAAGPVRPRQRVDGVHPDRGADRHRHRRERRRPAAPRGRRRPRRLFQRSSRSRTKEQDWAPVLAALADRPDLPAATVLADPTLAGAVRLLYTDGRAVPAELVAEGATVEGLETRLVQHLFGSFPPYRQHGGMGGHRFQEQHRLQALHLLARREQEEQGPVGDLRVLYRGRRPSRRRAGVQAAPCRICCRGCSSVWCRSATAQAATPHPVAPPPPRRPCSSRE